MNDSLTRTVEALPAASTETMISVRGLKVEFPLINGPPVVALQSLDFDIERGEIFGLVGESGAGKTTLARSLLRLPPEPGRITSGQILFEGRDILAMDQEALRRLRGRRMSMIVPNPRGELNPLQPIGAQIATMARVHLGADRDNARQMALKMLRAVQIPDPERRMRAFAHELSGGMAQRVVIAIALVCSPSFIVSDDATSGLDVTVQAQILDLLRRLARERGSSMLFITRDMGITAHFCDRIAVMYRGEIVEIADREDFFFRPRHPYTIMLMAAFSYNQKLRRIWSQRESATLATTSIDGCAYIGRCPLAQKRCQTQHPQLTEIAPGHHVRCHFPIAR